MILQALALINASYRTIPGLTNPTAQFRAAGWRSMAPAPMPILEVHGPSLPWPAMTARIAMGRSAQGPCHWPLTWESAAP